MSQRDLGASVRQRLLNQAQGESRPFQELLQYYAMERFLYRLARSPHADEFILKGALLLSAWRSPLSRSTMDIDLLGKTSNKLDHIRSIFSKICVLDVEPDGMSFDPASLETARIKEDADYEGVRVRFNGILARARISMQIDIGFGDVVLPEITTIEYPTLLEFPVPVLRAYPKEAVIAEKLEAMTVLAALNSRMKDFFDLWALSQAYSFDSGTLMKAITATFHHRGTALQALPIGMSVEFANSKEKSAQWTAFLRRARLESAPKRFADIVAVVRQFAHPVLSAASSGDPFIASWMPGGPWLSIRQ